MGQLRRALSLAIQRWSPFKTVESAAVWSGRHASVYAWDSSKVGELVAASGRNSARCVLIPEPFHRSAGSEGPRLVVCIDGFEGQVWKGGFLQASRWWPAQPSKSDWLAFLRTAREAPTPAQLDQAPVELALLETPWSTGHATLDDLWDDIDTPRFRWIATTAAGAVPIFLLAQWVALSLAGSDLDAERAKLMIASEPVRVEREAVLANLDAIDQMIALDRRPTQFEILHRVGVILTGAPVTIIDWTFDIEALEISLEAQSDIEATRYIELFESDPLFDNVSSRTLPQPRTLRFKMNITAPDSLT